MSWSSNRGNMLLVFAMLVPCTLMGSISMGWAQEELPAKSNQPPAQENNAPAQEKSAPEEKPQPDDGDVPPAAPMEELTEKDILEMIPELKAVLLKRGMVKPPSAAAGGAAKVKPDKTPEKVLATFQHQRGGKWDKGEQILLPLNVADSDLPEVLRSIKVTTQPGLELVRNYSVTVVTEDLRNQIAVQAPGLLSGSQFQIKNFRKMLEGKEVVLSVRPVRTNVSLTITTPVMDQSQGTVAKEAASNEAAAEEPMEVIRGRVLGVSDDQKLLQISKPADDVAKGREIREVPVDRIDKIRVLGESADVIPLVHNLQTQLGIGATTIVLTALDEVSHGLNIEYRAPIDDPCHIVMQTEVFDHNATFSGQAALTNKTAIDWKGITVSIFHKDYDADTVIYEMEDISLSRGSGKQFPLRFAGGALDQKVPYSDIIYIASPAADGKSKEVSAPIHGKLGEPSGTLLADEVFFLAGAKSLDSATKFLFVSVEKTPFSFDLKKPSKLKVTATRASDTLFHVTAIDSRNTFNVVGAGGRSVRYELKNLNAVDLCQMPVEIETGASAELKLVENPGEFLPLGKRVRLLPIAGDSHSLHVDLKTKDELSLPYAGLQPGNDPGQLKWLASRMNIPDGVTRADVGQLNAVRTLINGVCATFAVGQPSANDCCGKTPQLGGAQTGPLIAEAKSVADSVKEEIRQFLKEIAEAPCRACAHRAQLAEASITLRDLLLYVDELRQQELKDKEELDAIATQIAEVERRIQQIRASRGNARSAMQNALAAEAHRLRLKLGDIQNRIDAADDKLTAIALAASRPRAQVADNRNGNGNSDVVLRSVELRAGEPSAPIFLRAPQ